MKKMIEIEDFKVDIKKKQVTFNGMNLEKISVGDKLKIHWFDHKKYELEVLKVSIWENEYQSIKPKTGAHFCAKCGNDFWENNFSLYGNEGKIFEGSELHIYLYNNSLSFYGKALKQIVVGDKSRLCWKNGEKYELEISRISYLQVGFDSIDAETHVTLSAKRKENFTKEDKTLYIN